MECSVDFLDDINTKYADLEYELDQRLKKILADERNWESKYSKFDINRSKINDSLSAGVNSLDGAKKRNSQIIKDIEMTKARLRSRAIFSPLEMVLQKAIYNYVKYLATKPAGVRKTYGPVFV